MKTKLSLFSIILFCWGCNSQEQPIQPINFDYGKIENNEYVNNFFDFKIKIPTEWYIQNKDSLIYVVKDEMKDKNFTGNSENLKNHVAELKPSEINKAMLLSAFRYNVDSATDFNYDLIISAINLKNAPDTKTGKDLLDEMVQGIGRAKVKRNIIEEPTLVKIGNKDFYEMTTTMEVQQIANGVVKQKICATVINHFYFVMFLTCNNDKQLEELNKILTSAIFTKTQ